MSRRPLTAVLVVVLAAGLLAPTPVLGDDAAARMTLNMPSVPLGTFLKTVSVQGNLKLVTSAELAQKPVSVFLRDVSAKEALDAICAAYGLEIEERAGTGVFVVMEQAKGLTDSAIFTLQHVGAKDLKDAASALVSEEGEVEVDEVNNVITVRGLKKEVAKVRELVARVDGVPRQVLIEAVIAELNDDAARAVGIRWEPIVSYRGPARATKFPLRTEWVKLAESEDAWFYGFVSLQDFVARLELLESDGAARILASPRIATLDKKEAQIRIVDHIVIAKSVTYESEGLDVVIEEPIYEDVGVILTTTPHIHDDGTITLTVKPEVSTATQSRFFGEAAADTFVRDATTTVLLNDGQTLAIGGLLKTTETKDNTRVPGFARVPLLGHLFRHKAKSVEKTDLVVFLTPRLLDDERIREETEKHKKRVLTPKTEKKTGAAPAKGEGK